MTEHDAVNHPSHYTSHPSGIECLEITRHLSFDPGNALKYVWRVGLKGAGTIGEALEDLAKAEFYLEDYLREFGREFVVPDPAREALLKVIEHARPNVNDRPIRSARLSFLEAYLYGSATEAVVSVRRLIELVEAGR